MNNNTAMKYKRRKKRRQYNNDGTQIHTGLDVCDCLNTNCSGCFFPCPKCKSNKCGPTCRVNRRFKYCSLETEEDRYWEEHYEEARN